MGSKRVMRSGKKIAPPVSNKPRFNFIQDRIVSILGIEIKVWKLPPAEMESVLNGPVMDSASDDDSDVVFVHREFGCGYNPHEPDLSNSSAHHANVKKVSVGSTRRCKVNYLRKRQRLLAAPKLIKNRAPPSVPRFNFIQGTHVSARGVKTTVWRLPPAEMESVFKGPVMDSASDDDSDDVYLQREYIYWGL